MSSAAADTMGAQEVQPMTRAKRKKGAREGNVKTTVDLPRDLWRAASVLALDEGRSLRDLLEEGLRLVLKRSPKKGGRK